MHAPLCYLFVSKKIGRHWTSSYNISRLHLRTLIVVAAHVYLPTVILPRDFSVQEMIWPSKRTCFNVQYIYFPIYGVFNTISMFLRLVHAKFGGSRKVKMFWIWPSIILWSVYRVLFLTNLIGLFGIRRDLFFFSKWFFHCTKFKFYKKFIFNLANECAIQISIIWV